MRPIFMRSALAAVVASAFAAGALQAQEKQQKTFSALDRDNDGFLSMIEAAADRDAKQNFEALDRNNDERLSRNEYEAREAQASRPATISLAVWDVSGLYRTTWSAAEMIDADVRGASGEEIGDVKDIIVDRDGNISKVVVEVGGFFEIGDQHIGVPWKDVRIGANMDHIWVPLRGNDGTYSLYGRTPQGEDVAAAASSWRANELIGDYASLTDVPRYGMVNDLLFDRQGKLKAVVVSRGAGPWGAAGWYGYPYHGYSPGAVFAIPYRSSEVAERGRFDYGQLADESELAGERSAQRQQQASGKAQRSGAAAGGG